MLKYPLKKIIIPQSEPYLGKSEEQYLLAAIRSKWISSSGKFLIKFEKDIAKYLGLRFAIATSSGTTALHLALAVLGIKSGCEVLVPNLTFAATANAVIMTGAKPVLVDSCSNHWNLDPISAAKVITQRTKAIVVAHLLGHPCDMESILKLSQKYSLSVIEDCAEALGCSWNSRKIGGLGQIGIFSFYANKVITTGEGGVCVTDDYNLANSLRIFRSHGMNPEHSYWHEKVGFNYRMTNLSAAIGVAQLKRLPYLLARRRSLRNIYDQGLIGLKGICSSFITTGNTIDWLYPIFIDEKKLGIGRDTFLIALRKAGIDARPMFYPLHIMPPFSKMPRSESLIHSTNWGLSGILLPLYPKLRKSQVNYIITKIDDIVTKSSK